ncbi:bifunctional metallophosphatase/5'-nucleotidase [Heyndrickxia acidiproducens]|uniref:bifunctional metallophosphatase/5'-nucleotidase n=1 Tax=Heyndrickxia acidiproducens TaxID=1121084 RepID=UPI003BF4F5B3
MYKRIFTGFAALLLFLGISNSAALAKQPAYGKKDGSNHHADISVQLLGINDFHGQLDVTRKVGGKDVGRADYLAAYLKQYEKKNKNTLLVSVGDQVGASPPVSALLQDEPTIEVMNQIGFDVATVGNHEFDEGTAEMLRLINGGYSEKTGDFEGANFPYVAANVVYKDTEKPVLPPYVIKKVNGQKIGFIGVVTKRTPEVVLPSGVKDVAFLDEAESINKAAAELRKKGIHSIIVLAHVPSYSDTDGSNASGDLVDIAKKVNDDVDILYGADNHAYTNTVVDGKLIVQSYSYGTAFSDVDIKIDPRKKDIVKKEAKIITPYHDGIQPDPVISSMISDYEKQVGPLINEVVGHTDTAITRNQSTAGESALGNLIADAQRAEMGTDFAITNPGGIRADLNASDITWGELYTIQPFNNQLVKMSLTGAQIKAALNQQWNGSYARMLQISGFHYTWDPDAAAGDRIRELTLPDGTPLDLNQAYTITLNNFLAEGGDGFTAFTGGTNRETGPVDLDALVHYVKKLGNVTAQIEGRIQTE